MAEPATIDGPIHLVTDLIPDEEEQVFRPILVIWREVLKSAHTEKAKKVTTGWANRICVNYLGIGYHHMNDFRDRYYAHVLALVDILEEEIASDENCTGYTTPEEDATENRPHYKNLLLNWQKAILQWEMDWDSADDDAAIEIAAISEVHKMFFGEQGLTAFLDNISFEFNENDQAELAAALLEFRISQEG